MAYLVITLGVTITLVSSTALASSFMANSDKALEIKDAANTAPVNKVAELLQKKGLFLIAQKYGGDPHGPDPHGDDPADEIHDPKLPANQHRNDHKAPKDVYGGQVPNEQQPY